jgi:uncharacterized membrane protein YbaN (DUF454 family)
MTWIPIALHRPLLLVAGLVFVGLGLLGVVLPVLPTTPFMILAVWCFARSSRRLHDWLYHHRLFGPPLRQWDRHRVIPPIAKVASISAMTASMVYVLLHSTAPWYSIAAMGAVILYGAWYILTKPSRAPADEDAPLEAPSTPPAPDGPRSGGNGRETGPPPRRPGW